jgi:carbon-monoxide dehydrogenase medium subunit
LLDADFEVIGAAGSRLVKASSWFKGYLEPALEEREFLQSIRWRRWPAGHGYGFSEVARRRGDFAMAGAGALLELSTDRSIRRAAIVVFGVEPSPVRLVEAERALIGQKATDEAFGEAVAAACRLDAMSDVHVSVDYRRHLAGVVTRRALRDAARTCGESPGELR